MLALTGPSAAQAALAPPSGIRGLVVIGPACPVEPIQPAFECADKPFVATLQVRSPAIGRLIRSVRSNRLGRFTVLPPPGLYVLTPRPGPGIARPLAEKRTIRVLPRRLSAVRILYDSGIRFVGAGLR